MTGRFRGRVVPPGPILSSALVLGAYAGLFHLLDRYDWGQAFTRFACLAGLLLMTLATRPRPGPRPREASGLASLAAPALALVVLEWGLYQSLNDLNSPPVVDIGQTTQEAARLVLIEGENPYQSRTIAVLGDDPSMWGFKYGPSMILGYGLSAFLPRSGLKYTSLAVLGATAVLVFLLGRGRGEPGASSATGWFCVALALLPNRLWHELFRQGSNDILPVSLILGSILAVSRRAWVAAGLLAGLSLSAKVSPAVFYLILFVRRRPNPRFLAGFAAGLLPTLPFLAWDAGALVRNVALFHSLKAPDSTSLYSITPGELRVAFTAVQLAAVALVIAKNFREEVNHRSLIFWYLVLTLVCEMSYREVHGNHLIWFMPSSPPSPGGNRHAFPNIAAACDRSTTAWPGRGPVTASRGSPPRRPANPTTPDPDGSSSPLRGRPDERPLPFRRRALLQRGASPRGTAPTTHCGLPVARPLLRDRPGRRRVEGPDLDLDGEIDRRRPHVVAVGLSRNHGHQLALTAGLHSCRGERILIIDADLQDPPDILAGDAREDGRRRRGRLRPAARETARRRSSGRVRVALSADRQPGRGRHPARHGRLPADEPPIARRLPRHARTTSVHPRHGPVDRLPAGGVPVRPPPRYAGTTKFPLRKMVRFAVDAITAFLIKPSSSRVGSGSRRGCSRCWLVVYSLVSWIWGHLISGWTSLMCVIALLGSRSSSSWASSASTSGGCTNRPRAGPSTS